jgi:hypothetical protein
MIMMRMLSSKALHIASVVALCHSASVGAQSAADEVRWSPSRQGDVEIMLRNRAWLIPDRVVNGLKIQPTVGVTWMAADWLRLTLDAQTVDNSGPGRQGRFYASRTVPGGGSGNFLQEITGDAAVSVWGDMTSGRRLTISGSLSRGVRSYELTDSASGQTISGNRRGLVGTLAAVYHTADAPRRGSIGVVSAFLRRDDALYLRTLPGSRERFGTVVGPEVQAEVRLGGPVSTWGRAFVPLTGNNTIARSTGRAARAAAFDAGLRLHVNSALDVDVFASNALGNTGALAYIPDREYASFGTGVTVRPGARFAPGYVPPVHGAASVAVEPVLEGPPFSMGIASPALLPRRASVRIGGGGQGLLAGIDYGLVTGFQVGAFLDYTRGIVDEGELGAIARLQLFNEGVSSPVSFGVVVAGSRTNNPLINLLAGRRDELQRLGLGKGGFSPGKENDRAGRLYVITLATPLERSLDHVARIGFTPIVAVVQRSHVQVAGALASAALMVGGDMGLDASIGVDAGRKGNTLTSTGREHAIPWRAGVTWGRSLAVTAWVTNRVGDSPFHTLRVRADNSIAFGAGLRSLFP